MNVWQTYVQILDPLSHECFSKSLLLYLFRYIERDKICNDHSNCSKQRLYKSISSIFVPCWRQWCFTLHNRHFIHHSHHEVTSGAGTNLHLTWVFSCFCILIGEYLETREENILASSGSKLLPQGNAKKMIQRARKFLYLPNSAFRFASSRADNSLCLAAHSAFSTFSLFFSSSTWCTTAKTTAHLYSTHTEQEFKFENDKHIYKAFGYYFYIIYLLAWIDKFLQMNHKPWRDCNIHQEDRVTIPLDHDASHVTWFKISCLLKSQSWI